MYPLPKHPLSDIRSDSHAPPIPQHHPSSTLFSFSTGSFKPAQLTQVPSNNQFCSLTGPLLHYLSYQKKHHSQSLSHPSMFVNKPNTPPPPYLQPPPPRPRAQSIIHICCHPPHSTPLHAFTLRKGTALDLRPPHFPSCSRPRPQSPPTHIL